MRSTQVAIIGAGPAGISAAIQLKRYGIPFMLFEKSKPGGLLWNANLVENYPGFPEGITGPELIDNMRRHLDALDIKITGTAVTNIRPHGDNFLLTGDSGKKDTFKYIILATGTSALRLDEDTIDGLGEDKILYEVYKLSHLEKKNILIIGGGDAAFDYALNLAGKNNVIILHRSFEFKALSLLVERATNNPGITILPESTISGFLQDEDKIIVTYRNDNKVKTLEADYIIAAIGRKPSLDIISQIDNKVLQSLKKNYRIQIIGDAANGRYRQTAIACGDGIRAAMRIADIVRDKT